MDAFEWILFFRHFFFTWRLHALSLGCAFYCFIYSLFLLYLYFLFLYFYVLKLFPYLPPPSRTLIWSLNWCWFSPFLFLFLKGLLELLYLKWIVRWRSFIRFLSRPKTWGGNWEVWQELQPSTSPLVMSTTTHLDSPKVRHFIIIALTWIQATHNTVTVRVV